MSATPTAPKATAATTSSAAGKGKPNYALFIIIGLIIAAILIYNFVLGNPNNFEGGNLENHPVSEGVEKWMGTIHKGGVLVPVLISFLLMVITFSIERMITISKATGTANLDSFVRNVKSLLAKGDVKAAKAAADKQKGSVGNVIRTVLDTYEKMADDKDLAKEQKVVAIQKEIEEATALEVPMLEQNLGIIATLVSVSTLVALLGTVLGMIRAFSALATAGAPDSAALSTGISEALINTAFGIGTSAVATICYNYFTSRIDGLTYNIDEIGFSIVNNFKALEK